MLVGLPTAFVPLLCEIGLVLGFRAVVSRELGVTSDVARGLAGAGTLGAASDASGAVLRACCESSIARSQDAGSSRGSLPRTASATLPKPECIAEVTGLTIV